MKRLRRAWPIVRRVWITCGLGATVVFVTWSLLAYRANGEARDATESDASVAVERADGVWRFRPAEGSERSTELLFVPGALVDPRAYAPLARAVAEAGYVTTLVPLPRRGAFGGAESPELLARLRSSAQAATSLVMAGHSRGAVVLSRWVSNNPQTVDGLAIIGSSHPRDQDLSTLSIPVVKIVGTRDGLASPEEVRENAALLPDQTRWVWIEGGNHSQFGWYGFQPMDRRPRISATQQRAMMVREVLELLEEVEARAGE